MIFSVVPEADLEGGGVQGVRTPPPFIPNMYETTDYPEINYELLMLCVIVT